jgi:O-antigen/teichoic acid export membrane protein
VHYAVGEKLMESTELKHKAILKSSLLIIFLSLLSYCADYGVNLHLTKLLKASDFGDYAIAMSWVMLWSTVISLGGAKSIVRFFPSYFSNHDTARGAGIIHFYIWTATALGLAIALIGLAMAWFNVKGLHKYDMQTFHPLVLALFMLPLVSRANIHAAVLQSRAEYFWSTSPVKILLPLIFLFFVWLSQKWHAVATDRFMVVLMMVSYVVINFGQVLLLKFLAKVKLQAKKKIIEPKMWLDVSLPIMLASITFYLSSQADLTMLELLRPQEAELGYYAAATKIASILFILSGAIGAVVMPMMGQALEQGQVSAQRLYTFTFGLNLFISIGALIIIARFRIPLLTMFGAKYTLASSAMVILALGYACNAITSAALYFLQYSKFGKYSLICDTVGMGVNIVLNWLFIPTYGMTGAALATSIALFGTAVARFILVWAKMQLAPFRLSG